MDVPPELWRDFTGGVGDAILEEANGNGSRTSCFCKFHSRVTASLIAPGRGTPVKLVDVDLELECGVCASLAGVKLDDRLGLTASRWRGVTSRDWSVL